MLTYPVMEAADQWGKYLFTPESIAVIGASADFSKANGKPLKLLLDCGYRGDIYPVNPKYQEIAGMKCYPDLKSIPGPVEMALIGVAANRVLETMNQCAEKEVKVAVVLTSGFSEVGAQGSRLQEEMMAVARRAGIRVLGPNCLGVANFPDGMMATFLRVEEQAPPPLAEPKFSFITQSGGFGSIVYKDAVYRRFGFRLFASTGNEADLVFSDLWRQMLADQGTRVVGAYIEGLREGRNFIAAARQALGLKKPLLVVKVGRSQKAAKAAASHTGSLVGSDAVYDAVFRQYGIVRLDGSDEMVAASQLFLGERLSAGNRVGILSVSGGSAVFLADQCELNGLEVVKLQEETVAGLKEILPSYGSAQNPVDMTSTALVETGMLKACMRIMLADPGVDFLIVNFDLLPRHAEQWAREVVSVWQESNKPLIAIPWLHHFEEASQKGLDLLRQGGIPTIIETNYAVSAARHLVNYSRVCRRQGELPAAEAEPVQINPGKYGEYEAGRILADFGLPMVKGGRAETAAGAVSLAESLGFPVAMKIDSPDILHKSDAGGVALNIGTRKEVEMAFARLTENALNFNPSAEIRGVLVQQMLPAGREIIAGIKQDPVFGPVIMVGLGGIFVEVLKDVAMRVAPITRTDAREMLTQLKGYPLLQGVRGEAPADQEAMIALLLQLSRLATAAQGKIQELDLNPVIVYPQGLAIADALMVVK